MTLLASSVAPLPRHRNRFLPCLVGLALGVWLSACATGRQVELPAEGPLRFDGVSVDIPDAPGWTARDTTDAGGASLAFGREIGPGHTVAASLITDFVAPSNRRRWDADMAGRPDEERLDVALDEIRRTVPLAEPGVVRDFRRVPDAEAALPGSATCTEYRYETTDERVPGSGGQTFLMLVRGLLCIHPDLGRPVLLGYSERASAPDRVRPAFEAEADRYFRSLAFLRGDP